MCNGNPSRLLLHFSHGCVSCFIKRRLAKSCSVMLVQTGGPAWRSSPDPDAED